MPYQLLYHPDVPKRDLPRINRNLKDRIRKAIEQRLMADPLRYGEPLRRGLKGYRKMRVGDYRVIYEIHGAQIRIYAIGNRRDVYESSLRSWPGL
jgi:mRNA interferase RelE/StbE